MSFSFEIDGVQSTHRHDHALNSVDATVAFATGYR